MARWYFAYAKHDLNLRISRMFDGTFSLDAAHTNSFIRPLLEYADTVWGSCTRNAKLMLEKMRNDATRIMLDWHQSPVTKHFWL